MKRNFNFQESGNLFGITARTKKATAWLKDNLSYESWQVFGPTIWIDIRCADDIVEAIQNDF